jgi:hypothetical protein
MNIELFEMIRCLLWIYVMLLGMRALFYLTPGRGLQFVNLICITDFIVIIIEITSNSG